MLIDILFLDNDTRIVSNDVLTVQDKGLLKQNVLRRLTTPKGSIFFDPPFGSELHNWINSSLPPVKYISNHIKEVLTGADEVDPLSISVRTNVTVAGELTIEASFSFLSLTGVETIFLSYTNNNLEAYYES